MNSIITERNLMNMFSTINYTKCSREKVLDFQQTVKQGKPPVNIPSLMN